MPEALRSELPEAGAAPAPSGVTLLRVGQVAAALGVHTRSVWRLADRGELPSPVRLGRAVRWRLTDLHNHLERLSKGGQR